MNISSVQPRSTVTGTTTLQSTLSAPLPVGAAEIKYLLLNPDTGTGYVIARGTALDVAYEWLPAMRDNGTKVLVAAVYNSSGKFLSGDAIPIQVALQPVVSLTGIEQNQTVNTSVRLGANLNFSAAYVKYQITNTTNSKTVTTAEQDPIGGYQWTPSMEYNGDVTVTVTAYDQKKQPYASQAVQVKVEMPRKLSLSGVKAGQTVDKPVTLAASRNFDVIETEYYSRDVQTGSLLLLARVQYVSYSWFPGPGMAGNKELFVRVKATDGTVYNSAPIQVNVIGAPKLLLQGAGPNQMITTAAPAKLKVESNVLLSSVKYLMTNTVTGTQKVIADLKDASQVYTYTPAQGDNGSWKIKAVGTYGTGQTASTEEVTVKVYTGKIYTAQPIIEKSKFLNMASSLAVVDFNKSGMSAALQTAQAILETGWGQSVPVDKYSGQFSSNLFGIKGTGTAGSVISNTWEEYNGVAFRVDAKFRAYYSVNESWWDHNKLLMTGTRYEPFRNVMFDSSLGAWALRRAGYATDSKYPVKLMDIIETYQLEQLDQVGI
jgi:flagellum-specific peptidoglycan hydrolase FlgJ